MISLCKFVDGDGQASKSWCIQLLCVQNEFEIKIIALFHDFINQINYLLVNL